MSCCRTEVQPVSKRVDVRSNVRAYGKETILVGRRLLLIFPLASFLGYLVNDLVPTVWMHALFGSGKGWSVPLAATLGIPFYLNTSSSLPIIRAFLDNGASPGSALAFLLVGAGTSLGALAGLLTIARWRVVLLVVCTLLPLAIIFGYLYDILVVMRIF